MTPARARERGDAAWEGRSAIRRASVLYWPEPDASHAASLMAVMAFLQSARSEYRTATRTTYAHLTRKDIRAAVAFAADTIEPARKRARR